MYEGLYAIRGSEERRIPLWPCPDFVRLFSYRLRHPP